MAAEEASPVGRSRGSGRYAAELQRGRLLSAAFTVVGELGYEGLSARSVSERAGMSNRTFYECFSDREDCFLAAFNHAVEGLELELRGGWESELGWTARVRAGLTALLRALDREPGVGRLVFVEALAAGPRALACRARVLESVAAVIDEGRANAKAPAGLPGLTAEGVVGATFGVIHARLLELRPEPLVELRGALMAGILFPYRGAKAATRELEHPAPGPGRRGAGGAGSGRSFGRPAEAGLIGRSKSRTRLAETVKDEGTPIVVLDYRLTVRARMALAAVAGRPGLNNREVSEIIGLADQGQISRMMRRLCDQGLVENAQAHTNRQARAWRLTSDGEAVIDSHGDGRAVIKAQRRAGNGDRWRATQIVRPPGPLRGDLPSGRGPGPALRMTTRTRQVLAVVTELSESGAGPSNREIATAAGVKDEGQISRLLARLQTHGLLTNTAGPPKGANAWRLTQRGEETLSPSSRGASPSNPQEGPR